MMWLRATSSLLIFIAFCSIERVTSLAELISCEGTTCQIPFGMSCTALAADLDYSGECCSLVKNSENNNTCTLISTSSCYTYNRLSECYSIDGNIEMYDDVDASGMNCFAGHHIAYVVDNITESPCPASEIDVLSRAPSSKREWSGLVMSLTGVAETDLSNENVNIWEEVTENHILSFLANARSNVGIGDVKGYLVFKFLNQTETENQISITYYQQLSWRMVSSEESEEYIDPERIPVAPFLSAGDLAAYVAALNKNGIPATQVNVTMEAPTNVGNSTGQHGMGTLDDTPDGSSPSDQPSSAGENTEDKNNTDGDDGSNSYNNNEPSISGGGDQPSSSPSGGDGDDGDQPFSSSYNGGSSETIESASGSAVVASTTTIAILLVVALL